MHKSPAPDDEAEVKISTTIVINASPLCDELEDYMDKVTKSATRRTVLIGAATAVAAIPLLAPRDAKAGIITQANAKYQNQPKGAAHCSLCSYFIPGAKPGQNGACKQVAGVISPNGWCQFYAKKPGAA